MVKPSKSNAKPRRHGCPEEVTFLELLRTTDQLTRRLVPVLKDAELSATQYNVLRILRGSPEGLPCGEIASRMITRDPDITRLLDRMEKRQLISRSRESQDRRRVLVRISPAGMELLGKLDGPVEAQHRALLGHLGRERMNSLCRLLRTARGEG